MDKSFASNWEQERSFDEPVKRFPTPKKDWLKLFGYDIASPLGVPACPWATSKGITYLSRLGFDIFTYKTIRSVASPAHAWPNICYIASAESLLDKRIYTGTQEQTESKAFANSIGNASFAPDIMQQDIAKAKGSLSAGQLLIVSIYGTEQKTRSLVQDYVYTALLAQEAGAQAIECNFSCPNIPGEAPLCKQPELVYEIVKKVSNAVNIPVMVKVCLFDNQQQLKDLLVSAARAGAQGICGLNTIPAQIINKEKQPYFGKERAVAGISGEPIRSQALQFIKDAYRMIKQEKLDMTLFGTGGITKAEHFDQFFCAGADVAMSATGLFFNHHLGIEWHETRYNKGKAYKERRI